MVKCDTNFNCQGPRTGIWSFEKKINRFTRIAGYTASPMRYWQPKLGRRTLMALRYGLMVGSGVAGLLFSIRFFRICIFGVRDHLPAAMWYLLPSFGTFAGFAFYISQNLWR